MKNIIKTISKLVLTAGCFVQLLGAAFALDVDSQNAQFQLRQDTPASNSSGSPSVQTPDKSLDAQSRSTETLSPIRIETINADRQMEVYRGPDLWDRIREGFAMPGLEIDAVHEREQWLSNKGDYVKRMTEHSSKYLYYIVEELENRRMPTELALLPFVESAFNPQAVSSAKASGMWQFMPQTGKFFDLKQNAFRDDRRDVLASTRAALDYLQKLYVQFGDWHLALAAYNWGGGNVSKAIQRSKNAGLSGSYTDLNMPLETKLYVPRLIALKNLVLEPSRFGVTLADIPNHPYFQTVPLPRDMDVRVAAHLADITMEDFTALNPSAHRPVLLAGGTPQILLPWDNAEIFQRNYEAFGGKLASWTVWVAPSTMTAAEAAKRYKMSENEFRSINNIPPRMLIKAGSALLVPRGDKVKSDVSAEIADSGQINFSPEITLKKSQLRVMKKETLDSFASKHRIKAPLLAEWNHLNANSTLKPGDVLIIYTAQSVGANRNFTSGDRRKQYKVAHRNH